MKRRTVLIGGAALAGAGLLALRPAEGGGMHDAYFAGLSAALKRAGLMHPVLVIDRQRLSANIAAIRSRVTEGKLPLRVVAKSLPSPALLSAVMVGMGTQRLMVFSAEMLLQLLPLHSNADYLMGKPLPASEFVRVIDRAGAEAVANVQWLIDTPERLKAYGEVAKARGLTWQASLEIDVG
ncbi:MAG: alanine racemase, partial [Novosphingobium sp.]